MFINDLIKPSRAIIRVIRMTLEKIQAHPERADVYLNRVITPHESVHEIDKLIIKNIFLEEFARTMK